MIIKGIPNPKQGAYSWQLAIGIGLGISEYP